MKNEAAFITPTLPASLAIVIPPTQPLDQGLKFAEGFRAREKSLWIFGHGLTLRERPKEWSESDHVTFLELGALYPADEVEATAQRREQLVAWFQQLGSDHAVLLSCAYSRFLYRTMESAPLTEGIRELAQSTRILCSDPSWPGIKPVDSPGKLSPRDFFKLVALAAGGLVLAVARTAKDAWRRRKLLVDLRRRREQKPGPPPNLWLTVHHEWARFNPHLVDSFGLTAMQAEVPPGILFQGDLLPGERDHFTLERTGNGFYGGLGPLRAHLDRLHLDQLVIPESLAGVATAILRTLIGMARVLARLSRLQRDSLVYSPAHLGSWAKMLSMDLVRANLARQATREAVARSLKAGCVVINYGAQGAAPIAADLQMQESGITTVDFCHGAGIEMQIPILHTTSSLATAWTEVDAQLLERLGYAAVATGMPIRRAPEPTAAGSRPINLLLASNYVHRDTAVQGFYPLSEFHHYLGRLPALLANSSPATFCFRWRPHPADSPDEIQKALNASSEPIELSVGPLSDDLAWADLVVTSMSSLIFEALLADRPVFVQILPRFRATRYAQAIDSRRKFFLLEDCIRQIAFQLGETGPGTEPELCARRAFFGNTGWPAGQEALWERLAQKVSADL